VLVYHEFVLKLSVLDNCKCEEMLYRFIKVAELTKFLQKHLCTLEGRPKRDYDIYYLTDVWFPEV